MIISAYCTKLRFCRAVRASNGIAKVDAAAADPGNRRVRAGSRDSAVESGVPQERPGRGGAKAEIPGRGGLAGILQRSPLVQVSRRRRRPQVRSRLRRGGRGDRVPAR